MPKTIKCRACKEPFEARFIGQKTGQCDACNAERCRLAALRRKPRKRPEVSEADLDAAEREMRMLARGRSVPCE